MLNIAYNQYTRYEIILMFGLMSLNYELRFENLPDT